MNTAFAAGVREQAMSFHAGERAVQRRMGVDGRLAEIGPRVIRDQMPDQHREFFAQLPFLVAGSVDAQGQPWASMLTGAPGFAQSPDARHLAVHAQPLPGDPLRSTLQAGAAIGLLGIEPHTRRRNRLNGSVQQRDDDGFVLEVQQSFGNCSKYIHPRRATIGVPRGEARVNRSDRLDAESARWIAAADTFFIASAFMPPTGTASRAYGVDVSHRGGPAGFVRVDGERELTVPDYVGNFFFNTLGNLQVNPRAGLLFVDFDTGATLQLAVDARIVWDGPEVDAIDGAERLLKLTVREVLRIDDALPLAWSAPR